MDDPAPGSRAGWRSPSGSCSPSWPWRSTASPTSIATTTTSSGRRPHSSRVRRRSATRSRRPAGCWGMRASRTSCRSPPPTVSRRALLPFPPLPALVLLPFVAIWGLAVNDQAIFIVLAGVDVALCWWAHRPAAGQRRRPPRHDDLLRLRHGLLVHRPDHHHLVPGAHRRGRADLPVDRHRARGRPRGGRG